MSAPDVSLLLPAPPHGAATTLRALEAIARLPETPAFELVLVVDAQDGPARQLASGLEGDVQVLVEDGLAGPFEAYDKAAAVAQAPLLVLLDAEATPADGWLGALAAAFGDDAVAAALPRSIGPSGEDRPDASWLALATRAEAYASVGGFAATGVAGRADKATLVDALRGAGTVVAVPSAVLLG